MSLCPQLAGFSLAQMSSYFGSRNNTLRQQLHEVASRHISGRMDLHFAHDYIDEIIDGEEPSFENQDAEDELFQLVINLIAHHLQSPLYCNSPLWAALLEQSSDGQLPMQPPAP